MTPIDMKTAIAMVREKEAVKRNEIILHLQQLTAENSLHLSPILAWVLTAVGSFLSEKARYDLVSGILLARPEWINMVDDYSLNTPLMHAVNLKHLPLVKFMLDKGSDPKFQNKDKHNALDVACFSFHHKKSYAKIIETLIKTGLFTDNHKSKALLMASQCFNVIAVDCLLAHGAQFSVKGRNTSTKNLETALSVVSGMNQSNTQSIECATLMLASPHVHMSLNWGWHEGQASAISCAARSGNRTILSQLIQAGAKIDPDENDGVLLTPLMEASFGLNLDCINLLVTVGADPSRVDQEGKNAIHWLASCKESGLEDPSKNRIRKCLAALMDAGCDACVADANGDTAIEIAKRQGLEVLVKLLTPLHEKKFLDRHTADVVRKKITTRL